MIWKTDWIELVNLALHKCNSVEHDCIILFIFTAREAHIDVVLIDTAGRMQDNEPLMRALAKVT